jgi:hypothetical protein
VILLGSNARAARICRYPSAFTNLSGGMTTFIHRLPESLPLEIYFLWRPYLRDPRDDLVLELAVKAGCRFIVTYNQRDFAGCERFGVEAIRPGDLLRRIGEVP